MSRSHLARLDDALRPEAPAERLAAVRLLTGVFALVYLLARAPAFVSLGRLPASHFAPIGVVRVLSAPLPFGLVVAQSIAALALAVPFTLGLRFAVTGPLFAAALLWITTYRSAFGMIFHTENLLALHVIALAFTDAAAAWSLDAKRAPAPAAPARRFGAALTTLTALTTFAYALAGVAKLRVSGLDWATGEALRNHIAHDNLRKALLGDPHSPIGGWLVQFGWLFPPLAALTFVVELAAPIALFHRKFGQIWALAAWGFHAGVLLTMWIFFPYPLSGIALASLFEPEHKLAPIVRKLGLAPPTPTAGSTHDSPLRDG